MLHPSSLNNKLNVLVNEGNEMTCAIIDRKGKIVVLEFIFIADNPDLLHFFNAIVERMSSRTLVIDYYH